MGSGESDGSGDSLVLVGSEVAGATASTSLICEVRLTTVFTAGDCEITVPSIAVADTWVLKLGARVKPDRSN